MLDVGTEIWMIDVLQSAYVQHTKLPAIPGSIPLSGNPLKITRKIHLERFYSMYVYSDPLGINFEYLNSILFGHCLFIQIHFDGMWRVKPWL